VFRHLSNNITAALPPLIGQRRALTPGHLTSLSCQCGAHRPNHLTLFLFLCP